MNFKRAKLQDSQTFQNAQKALESSVCLTCRSTVNDDLLYQLNNINNNIYQVE